MKIKVESVIEGNYECDSLLTTIDKEKISIAFDKKDNIKQYVGKLIEVNEHWKIVSEK